MKIISFLSPFAAILTLLLSLSGCVAIDSRAEKEPVDKEASQNISGKFQNSASYRSETMGFVGAASFTDLLDIYLEQKADSFLLSFTKTDGLTVEFNADEKKIYEKTFGPMDGFKFNANGKIELKSTGGCGGHDSPGFGCMSKTVTLFLNPDGDLVTVQSGGGAGVLGILPFGVYGKLVAVYSRLK